MELTNSLTELIALFGVGTQGDMNSLIPNFCLYIKGIAV